MVLLTLREIEVFSLPHAVALLDATRVRRSPLPRIVRHTVARLRFRRVSSSGSIAEPSEIRLPLRPQGGSS